MDSGIYIIINNLNDNFYVGSAKNYRKRWQQHKNDLKRNKHNNTHLQRSYNKHGDVFSYYLLEECENENLLKVEQTYLDKYVTLKECYNIGIKSSGGDNLTNNPNRKDIIKRIGKSLCLFHSKLSKDEEKEKYGKKGKENANFGNIWSDEMREKASKRKIIYFKNNEHYKKDKTFEEIFGEEMAKKLKKNLSNCAKERTGDKNPFFGKKHSSETKEKIKNTKLGKYYGKQNIPFTINGVKYESLGEASKKLDIHITTIRWRIKSNNIKFKDYKYNANI